MTRPRRLLLIAAALAAVAGGASACGEEGVSSDLSAEDRNSAALFVERCSGCHTLTVAGTEGSTTNVRTRESKDGPNFDQRKETEACVLFAIRNGGFSSGPMPQNIVTGPDAEALARFVAKHSGSEVEAADGESAPVRDCPEG